MLQFRCHVLRLVPQIGDFRLSYLYQRATLPNEPKSRFADFTPIARKARTIVEKLTLFPLSILDICALLTPINSPNCS